MIGGFVDEVPWALSPFSKLRRKTFLGAMAYVQLNREREIRREAHKKTKKRRHMVEASRRANRR